MGLRGTIPFLHARNRGRHATQILCRVPNRYEFKNGISIRDRDSGQVGWEQSIVKRTLTEEEYGKVTGAHHWLCAVSEKRTARPRAAVREGASRGAGAAVVIPISVERWGDC